MQSECCATATHRIALIDQRDSKALHRPCLIRCLLGARKNQMPEISGWGPRHTRRLDRYIKSGHMKCSIQEVWARGFSRRLRSWTTKALDSCIRTSHKEMLQHFHASRDRCRAIREQDVLVPYPLSALVLKVKHKIVLRGACQINRHNFRYCTADRTQIIFCRLHSSASPPNMPVG